jgi:hypothetical protein
MISLDEKEVKRHDVLFIVTDGELKMPGHNTLLLVITGSVASKFENFSGKVLEDGSEVDWKGKSVDVEGRGHFNTYQEHQHQHVERSCHA